MSDAKDNDYEYVEVRVSKKIAITISPEEVLALARKETEEKTQRAVERASGLAGFGQRLKSKLLGGGGPPEKSG